MDYVGQLNIGNLYGYSNIRIGTKMLKTLIKESRRNRLTILEIKNHLHVAQLLGYRNIKNTVIYTHLVRFEGDEYYSAMVETTFEAI